MRFAFIILLAVFSLGLQAQDDQKVQVNGYVKDMVTFNKLPDEWWIDNLLHNRVNFQWDVNHQWAFKLEVRNRFFFGDQVNNTRGFGKLIDSNNDVFDLSLLLNGDNSVGHFYIDRIYTEYATEKLNLRVGRQRINWGLNLVWNPNDIFNAYSFFDFDYEERPGSDAIRFEYFRNYASSFELAVRMADQWKDVTIGGMYKFNQAGYDVQLLGGYMKQNLVIGGGWAGNLSLAGFKGELSYFHDLKEEKGQFISSVSIDYSFPNSLYFNGSALFNSEGRKEYNPVFLDPSQIDVRSLSPYKYSYFLQSSFSVNPLISLGLSGLLFQDNSYFIMPFVTLSMLKNLDLDMISQLYYPGKSQEDMKAHFIRLKYSY